jgi:hypothetical protein
MTFIPSSFADGAAMLLFMNSRQRSTSQDQVDKIVEIIRTPTTDTTDVFAAFDGAKIDTTDGDEGDDSDISITAYNDAKVTTGGGRDDIGVYDRAIVSSGSGDDKVTTYGYGTISSGAGNDYVYGNSYMRVDAGTGDDEIRTSGYSVIDAGDGGDLVVTLGYSQVDGGAGNDTLIAVDTSADHVDQVGHAVLRGGEGDDDIQIGRNSVASGGAGNDTITLMRWGSTVEFARGDGQDKVFAAHDLTLDISGYGKGDVMLTKADGNLVVSFAGSDDSITINLPDDKIVRFTFDNGTEMAVNGADEELAPRFTVKSTSPEWRNALPYFEGVYSGNQESSYTLPEEYGIHS